MSILHKGDSKRLNLGGAAPRCPLCVNNERTREHFMEKKYTEHYGGCFIFVCEVYKVAIRVDDPFVGKWEAAYAKAGKIACPNCDADMRYFCTSVGFMKAVCPKKSCGASLANAQKDRHDHGGPNEVASPDAPGLLQ